MREGLLCIAAGRVDVPLDAIPASVTLKNSVFWANPGPDVVMDQAGRILMENNRFFLCTKEDETKCPPKKVASRVAGASAGKPSWKDAALPAGKTILWQRPSPFPQAAYQSRLNGDPVRSSSTDKAMLHTPGFCEGFDFQ